MEEGKGEESLVALLGEEFLFKLDKISFKVDHFWCTAVRPAQKRKQSIIRSIILALRLYYFYSLMVEYGYITVYLWNTSIFFIDLSSTLCSFTVIDLTPKTITTQNAGDNAQMNSA